MADLKLLLDFLEEWYYTLLVLAGVGAFLALESARKKRSSKTPGSTVYSHHLTVMVIFFLGVVATILSLPVGDSTRGQILGLFSVLCSAVFALSASTFVGNALAGFMLGAIRSFRPGDFIQVDEQFGRVTERGLFHSEIQTENRDLTTMPNLMLVTRPVTVMRSSGTIIHTDVSLGYDVPRTRIEKALLTAAKDAGLEDPFVRTMALGDFSVSYRISGLLPKLKHFLTSRSNLRNAVLDALHDDNIEIVSPNFMNQRIFDKEDRFVPRLERPRTEPESPTLESLAFDKADEAASVELLKEIHQRLGEEIEALKADKKSSDESPPSRQERKKTIKRLAKRHEHIEALIRKKETRLDRDD